MDYKNQKKVDKSLTINERIGFLKYCADLYETNGASPISDAEYDAEYYELEEIEPNHEFFDTVGGLAESHIYGEQVKHYVKMGSLNKSLDIDSYDKWLKSVYQDVEVFVLQHKIDGLALSLIYENGNLTRAATRGDGDIGIDVTNNAIYVKGVKNQIDCKDKMVEVRGECFINKQLFYKKWHRSVKEGGYKNPRNYAAGSLNQIDPTITKERDLEFVAYEVVQKDFEKESDKVIFLYKQGFPTLKDSTRLTKCKTLDEITKAVKIYMDSIDRASLPYDIDGAVVKLNDTKKAKSMGYVCNGRKPKAHRAVKFPPEIKETVLVDVENNVGRTGVITPVAILKPVELGGAVVTRATLHNYGSLKFDKKLKIGAKVLIAKKGDIIPQIIEVKENGDKEIDIPIVCPSCGEFVGWNKNKVDIVCENINCPAQLNKKIEHWFKKIGVKGIAGGTISKLTDPDIMSWDNRAIIKSLPEMYYMLDNDRATEHPFRKYKYLSNFFGAKAYSNIVKNINSKKEITLSIFIQALGIGMIGTTASDIVDIAPTIEDVDNLTVKDIVNIDGFAETKAERFVKSWKILRKEIDSLLKYIEIKKEENKSDKLVGKSFCFTGKFSNPTRKEMEKMVVENGGKITSVSKNLTALVWDGEMEGGKYEKAQKLGIEIVNQDQFLDFLN